MAVFVISSLSLALAAALVVVAVAFAFGLGMWIAERLRADRPSPEAASRALEVHVLANDLDAAIVRGQLFLVHQPKSCARDGRIEGVETLVRWRHPERGLVGPNEFIGMAEERGEIRRITEWVVRQTIVEQRSLVACGHVLACNINISAFLLADRDFAHWLLEAVRGSAAPIGLEITETAMINDPVGALSNLHLFADAGLRIAIDDYGAGLSSLAYLKQLPAHELKIDRLFIQSLSTSHRDPLLVRSTIDLAHALGMQVTAEGVDSAAAMALLRVMGCDMVQGYLLAKPMPMGELRAFLDQRADQGEDGARVDVSWNFNKEFGGSTLRRGGIPG